MALPVLGNPDHLKDAPLSVIELEQLQHASDNMIFPGAEYWHSLQATKKQDKEPDKFPSNCRHRIEESTG